MGYDLNKLGRHAHDAARKMEPSEETVQAKLPTPNPLDDMNGAEREWAAQLDARRKIDPANVVNEDGTTRRVVKWLYEPWRFLLAKGTSYLPDFYVLLSDGHVEIHEVKQVHRGKKSEARSGWSSTSITKFKIAAEMFPEFRWVACEKQLDRSWSETVSGDLFKRSEVKR